MVAALFLRTLAALAFALVLAGSLLAQTTSDEQVRQLEIGRRIYTKGVVADGSPLKGVRFGNAKGLGEEVACVACHRPSGLGQVEGSTSVPPIAGNFLYATAADKQLINMDPRVSKFFNQAHDPYTEASLASAIVNGINNRGETMSLAMPRYALSSGELQALGVYLKQLSAQWSPGASTESIRFATVITPDVDPVRRQLMKDMLQLIVRQKNGSTHAAKDRRTRHHMTTAAELILGTERKWELDIWELQGSADTWSAQLEERYRRQPVFALLSGLSNGGWQPVHDFCEREQVPCWFPSVKVSVQTPSKYAFYFSGGVALEAQVLAKHLLTLPQPKRLVQVYRDGESGRAGAAALRLALQGTSIALESRVLGKQEPAAQALGTALATVPADATLMLWLCTDDVAALQSLAPAGVQRYFSAQLAQGEHAPLPPAWRTNSQLIYPYALPERRATQLIYFNAWRNLRKIPLLDEALQSEVFFALNFMTDTVSDMLENYYRDYLVERAESMLSRREGVKAEQEARDRTALGAPGELEKKHGHNKLDEATRVPLQQHMLGPESQGTTMYPRLSLGSGQRFASKGAYLVRFADMTGETLLQESDWIVP